MTCFSDSCKTTRQFNLDRPRVIVCVVEISLRKFPASAISLLAPYKGLAALEGVEMRYLENEFLRTQGAFQRVGETSFPITIPLPRNSRLWTSRMQTNSPKITTRIVYLFSVFLLVDS